MDSLASSYCAWLDGSSTRGCQLAEAMVRLEALVEENSGGLQSLLINALCRGLWDTFDMIRPRFIWSEARAPLLFCCARQLAECDVVDCPRTNFDTHFQA